MKKYFNLALTLVIIMFTIFVTGCKPNNNGNDMLYLNYKENFKIIVLADMQVANTDECEQAFLDVTPLIQAQKPDLIVLTGDNVQCPQNEDVVDMMINKLESFNIPYAPVFGNHDSEGKVTKLTFAKKFKKAKNCYFLSGPNTVKGVGNYVINLTENDNIKFSLFFMDSNIHRNYGEIKGYDYIYPSQIKWYKNKLATLQNLNGTTPNSFIFFHIPLPEYNDAKKLYEQDNSVGFGVFREKICSPLTNTGLFSAMKDLNSTKAVFCGHDHINNCDIMYQDIRLNYCLKSSRYSYFNEDMLGVTQITIKNNNSFTIENIKFK